jgi:hypothetical protein
MSVHEAVSGLAFLYTTLTGDATLMAIATGGVYRGMAPDQTVPPFIILALQSSSDSLTANAVRLLTQALYQVSVTGPAGMSTQLAQAAARIDDLLKRASGSVTGGRIDYCYREQPLFIDLPPENGVMWSRVGGLYRLGIEQI